MGEMLLYFHLRLSLTGPVLLKPGVSRRRPMIATAERSWVSWVLSVA